MIGNALWPQIFKREFLIKSGLSHRGKRKDVPFYGFGMDALFIFECKKRGMTSAFVFEDRPIYFYRRAENSITTDYSLTASLARVREYLDILPIIQSYYHEEQLRNGLATIETANFLMDYVQTLLDTVAQLPENERQKNKLLLKQAGYYPFEQPPECTYRCHDFISHKKGFEKLCGLLRYYSISPWGLEMATLCYRISRCKRKLRYTLRQNSLALFIKKKLKEDN